MYAAHCPGQAPGQGVLGSLQGKLQQKDGLAQLFRADEDPRVHCLPGGPAGKDRG